MHTPNFGFFKLLIHPIIIIFCMSKLLLPLIKVQKTMEIRMSKQIWWTTYFQCQYYGATVMFDSETGIEPRSR